MFFSKLCVFFFSLSSYITKHYYRKSFVIILFYFFFLLLTPHLIASTICFLHQHRIMNTNAKVNSCQELLLNASVTTKVVSLVSVDFFLFLLVHNFVYGIKFIVEAMKGNKRICFISRTCLCQMSVRITGEKHNARYSEQIDDKQTFV